MLARALQAGYVDIFSIDYAETKKRAIEMSNDPDARIKAAGTKLLVAMANHDLKLIELASGGKEVTTETHQHIHFHVPPPREIGSKQ